MKRTLLAIVAALFMATTTHAQRLTDVMAEARFITDKMVVELGLTKVQRDKILDLNLTYLDGINSYRDIDAWGWGYRNRQIKAMLSAKQWRKFKSRHYFYRPIGWRDNAYVHNIYGKYPRKGRPAPPPRFGKEIDKAFRPGRDFDRQDRPRPNQFYKPKIGKNGKMNGFLRDDKPNRNEGRPDFGKGRREFDNNSSEAIKMRREMRKGNRWAR